MNHEALQTEEYPDVLLKKGSPHGAAVLILKFRLKDLGYGNLDQNNPRFGAETEAAVRQFQKDKLLNPDGEVGPLTWHRLFADRTPVVHLATTIREVALEIALSQLYVREKTGKNDGEEVEQYLKSVGLGKGYAWCVAFPYWCFEKAATKLQRSNPLPKTAGVLDFYSKSKLLHQVTDPQKGDIGIMNFGGGKGHMFMVKKPIELKVLTVEGNTAADPTSAAEDRDGQGVFERMRKKNAAIAYLRFD